MSYDTFTGLMFMLGEAIFAVIALAIVMLALCAVFGGKKWRE